ncbi:MAG: TIGR04372 family glycosyltransferase [Chlamydiales bacterium]|nr:TIGR04372 family glycosyltransferase [Chlamydiales bacterium]
MVHPLVKRIRKKLRPIKKFALHTLPYALATIPFYLINPFYKRLLHRSIHKRLRARTSPSQLFLVTRGDFGTLLVQLQYIREWQEQREQTTAIFLTLFAEKAIELAHLISPNTEVIAPGKFGLWMVKYLGAFRVHYGTFARVYARLAVDFPQSIIFYAQGTIPTINSIGNLYYPTFYNRYLDQLPPPSPALSKEFLEQHALVCKGSDIPFTLNEDYIKLKQSQSSGEQRRYQESDICQILSLETPYVVFNITVRDNQHSHNRKKIFNPERYNVLFDLLIAEGYTVVLQGREEQPLFKERKGFIDYARSGHTSAKHDLFLYSEAAFAVMSTTGAENFATISNTPMLGLNYVELPAMTENPRFRFFPKHYKRNGKILNWKEVLLSSAFFEYGCHPRDRELEICDLEEEEMLEALQEFLALFEQNKWEGASTEQLAFRSTLTPYHMQLYQIPGLPCQAYLTGQAKL